MINPTTTMETVQQKFGSCLLSLQHCELLSKSLLAHTEITASAKNLQTELEAKMASVEKQTMGQVVGRLTEGTLVRAGAVQNPSMPGDDLQALVHFQYQIELPSEQYDVMLSSFKEVVDLRNELVHHLLQRFNIRKPESLTAASAYLDECQQIIAAHRSTLLGFTNALKLSKAQLAMFVESREFEDAVLRCARPD